MKLTICNETFHVEVQYAKRKKIKLEATPEGHLTLKVPRHTSEEDIVAFLESKSEFLMNLRQNKKIKSLFRIKNPMRTRSYFFTLVRHSLFLNCLRKFPRKKIKFNKLFNDFTLKRQNNT